MRIYISLWLALAATRSAAIGAAPFEGRIAVLITRGHETNSLLYAAGPEHLRIEVTGSTSPHPINILDLKSGCRHAALPDSPRFL
jgi:hypothetical protein